MNHLWFNMGYALAGLVIATLLQAIFLLVPTKYLLKSTWLESIWVTLHMASLNFVLIVEPVCLYLLKGTLSFLVAAEQSAVTAIGQYGIKALYAMMLTTTGLGLLFYVMGATLLGMWVLQQYRAKLDRMRAILILLVVQVVIVLFSLGLSRLQFTGDLLAIEVENFSVDRVGNAIKKNKSNSHSQAYSTINQVLADEADESRVTEVIMGFLFRPRNGGLTPTELQELIKIAESQGKAEVVTRLQGFGKMAVKLKQFELEAANKFLQVS